MAISNDHLSDVFVVRGSMPAGKWSQPAEAVEHHVRFRERWGEPGVTAICDGCPGWRAGLLNGHDTDEMARLEGEHTGMNVTVVRKPL